MCHYVMLSNDPPLRRAGRLWSRQPLLELVGVTAGWPSLSLCASLTHRFSFDSARIPAALIPEAADFDVWQEWVMNDLLRALGDCAARHAQTVKAWPA